MKETISILILVDIRHISIKKSTHIEGEGCSTADTLIHMVTNDAIILHFMQQTTDI